MVTLMPRPERFEILILGSGKSGKLLAWHMAQSGLRTAVVERRWIGGACPNVAHCSHYHSPLAEGLMVGDSVRCPWHHACFSLRTGEALRAPALGAVACWSVEQRDKMVFVQHKKEI